MKNVKVLGIGCANCKNTVQLIQQVVDELGVSIQLEVVHAGGIPAREAVQSWF